MTADIAELHAALEAEGIIDICSRLEQTSGQFYKRIPLVNDMAFDVEFPDSNGSEVG
jgi:hypothetical protein